MLDTTVKNILDNIWPMVLIITVILVTYRIVYIFKNKEQFVFYEEVMKLGFIIYIMCLFHVVTFQDVSWSTSNFIPFKEIFRYQLFSASFIKNVIGNLIMFLPYGFFVSYFLGLDKKRTIFILSIIVSFTIEITQLYIGRVFDVDDIILNVCGGIIGYYLYRLCHNIKDRISKFLNNNILYNVLATITICLITYYLFHVLGVSF